MSSFAEILDLFVSLVAKANDYTPAGIEKAFEAFRNSLRVHEHKPKAHASAAPNEFVKTTLKEAALAARTPVYIIAKPNKYGNMESTDYPGLVFKKDDKDRWVAFGLQGDGPNVEPLTLNALLVCSSAGWLYDKTNLAGSAKLANSELGVTL